MGALIDGLSPERRSDLTFLEDTKIKFRDADIYIQSSADGKILITADGTDADSINFVGKTSISGTAALVGDVEITGQPTINLPTTDTSSMLTIKDSETFPIFKVDGKGNVKAKGGVTKI